MIEARNDQIIEGFSRPDIPQELACCAKEFTEAVNEISRKPLASIVIERDQEVVPAVSTGKENPNRLAWRREAVLRKVVVKLTFADGTERMVRAEFLGDDRVRFCAMPIVGHRSAKSYRGNGTVEVTEQAGLSR